MKKVFISLAACLALIIVSLVVYKKVIRKQIASKKISLPIAKVSKGKLPDNPLIQSKNVFNTKKVFTYEAKYMDLHAGTATITLDPQKIVASNPEIKISANVKSSSNISSIYTLNAEIESRIDSKRYVPLMTILNQTDSFSKMKRRTTFQYFDNNIHFIEKGYRVHHGDYKRELNLPLNTIFYDEMSAAFLLGYVKLEPYSSLEIPVTSNRRFYKIKLNFGDFTEIHLKGFGHVKALKTSLEIEKDGKKYHIGKLDAYISPEHGNIPILISGKLETKRFKLGKITIALKEIKNL